MQQKKPVEQNNFFESLWFKFFPYWPLFAALSLLFLALAFVVTMNRSPNYEVGASLVINSTDDPPNSYSNQQFRALDVYSDKQIVDNEVLILKSRSLMKAVVHKLHLYAPIKEKGRVSTVSANLYSPVIVSAQDPDKLRKTEDISFRFDSINNKVIIDKQSYPIDQWIEFPFGVLKFSRNRSLTKVVDKELTFSLYNAIRVAESLSGTLKVSTANKLATVINLSLQTESPDEGAAIINGLILEYMRESYLNANEVASNTLSFVNARLAEVEQELDSLEKSNQRNSTLSESGKKYLDRISDTDRRIAEAYQKITSLDQVQNFLEVKVRRSGGFPPTSGIENPQLAQLLQRLNVLEMQQNKLYLAPGTPQSIIESTREDVASIRSTVIQLLTYEKKRLNDTLNLLDSTVRVALQKSNLGTRDMALLFLSRQQAVKRDLYSFLLQRREEAALKNASTIAENRIIDWAEGNAAIAKSKKPVFFLAALLAAFGLAVAYILYKENFNGKLMFRSTVEKQTNKPVIGEIMFAPESKSAFQGKQFERLAASIQLLGTKKTILITSHIHGEGKSFISKQLSKSLAQDGKKILMVQLSDQSVDIAAQDTRIYLAKKRADDVDDLLSAPETSRFDHIIIQAPPIETSSDAYKLIGRCDVVLIVVRHGYTPATLLRTLDQNVNLAEKAFIVLNGIKGRGFIKKEYGFGYGYGKDNVYNSKTS